MKKIKKLLKNKKVKKIIIGIILLPVLWFAIKGLFPKKDAPSYSVVEQVDTGTVHTGIQASGTIVAAQKLDLDIYKKSVRIDTVNVHNGSQVKKGDLLLSFDQSDITNELRSSQLSVAQARVDLEDQKIKSLQEDTNLSSLKNQLAVLNTDIDRQEQLLGRAKRGYLSENIGVDPHADDYDELVVKTYPRMSGTYVGNEGIYEIEIYSSSTDSGYSYKTSGLEQTRGSVYFDKEVVFGEKGLSITFGADVRAGDRWIISIPNADPLKRTTQQESYEDTKRNLEQEYQNNLIRQKSLEQEIYLLERNDAGSVRQLREQEKSIALSKAYQGLKDSKKIAEERNIIAPFDGTITGMRNVVVGTKPRNDNDDPVNLGKLVSLDYFVSFSLSVNDVAKVQEEQKIKVNIPSMPLLEGLEATITEISILPNESGLAQYDVRALINHETVPEEFVLREGISADVQIVDEQRSDVLRVAKAAIDYENGQASVLKVVSIDDAMQSEIEKNGALNLASIDLETARVPVELGLTGKNYIEIISGLELGDYIVSTISAQASTSLFGGDDGEMYE